MESVECVLAILRTWVSFSSIPTFLLLLLAHTDRKNWLVIGIYSVLFSTLALPITLPDYDFQEVFHISLSYVIPVIMEENIRIAYGITSFISNVFFHNGRNYIALRNVKALYGQQAQLFVNRTEHRVV